MRSMENRVFIDTNIFLDLILGRGKFGNLVENFLGTAVNQKASLFTSISCIHTIIYVLQKEKFNPEALKNTIFKINQLIELAQTNSEDISRAISSDFNDLEDAILFQTAMSNECGFFITRNVKDFPKDNNKIKVLLPEDYS